jgi:hypothetical protein
VEVFDPASTRVHSMDNKLETIWKEAVVANFDLYSGIYLEILRKSIKNSVTSRDLKQAIPSKIQTRWSLGHLSFHSNFIDSFPNM